MAMACVKSGGQTRVDALKGGGPGWQGCSGVGPFLFLISSMLVQERGLMSAIVWEERYGKAFIVGGCRLWKDGAGACEASGDGALVSRGVL